MAFLYSVIGDNTPENREWLEKIGYQMHGDYRKHNDFIFSFEATDVSIPMYRSLYEHEIEPFYKNELNCIGNPQLFQSVTAMRDDTSNNQWWVFDEDFDQYKQGDFVMGRFHRCSCYCHVATLSELQEHFQRV